MLDIINRRSLFITNITGHTSGKYSWKSYSVQSYFLAADSAPASGDLMVLVKNWLGTIVP
jgi:hypothetical protein